MYTLVVRCDISIATIEVLIRVFVIRLPIRILSATIHLSLSSVWILWSQYTIIFWLKSVKCMSSWIIIIDHSCKLNNCIFITLTNCSFTGVLGVQASYFIRVQVNIKLRKENKVSLFNNIKILTSYAICSGVQSGP